jgi:hypothetical protein
MDGGKSETGRRHQQRRCEQEPLAPEAVRVQTHQQREDCRAEQGRRAQHADRYGAIAEPQQIDRQQHTDESVPECAHGAGAKQHSGLSADPVRQHDLRQPALRHGSQPPFSRTVGGNHSSASTCSSNLKYW